MSIINKMLQELDKRHAAPTPVSGAAPEPDALAQQARAIKAPVAGSNLFWRLMAGIMLLVVVWVIWVMWQIAPRPVVTDRAYQSLSKARPTPAPTAPVAAATAEPATTLAPSVPTPAAVAASAPAVPAPAAVAASTPAAVPPLAVVAPTPAGAAKGPSPAPAPIAAPPAAPVQAPPAQPRPVQPPAASGSASKAVPAPGPAKTDRLRLATEIVTPARGRAAKSRALPGSTDRQTLAALGTGATPLPKLVQRDEPAAAPEAPVQKPRASAPAPHAPVQKPRASAPAPDAVRIDRRTDATPRERATSEYQRAMALVNQGRMAEGMDGLRAALAADPAYETARQTLVALLLEAKRTDEAAVLVRDGLAINPSDTAYAMLLARIHVERGDPHGALALLEKLEPTARGNADYRGFVAALQQRLGRHMEAVEQYQAALHLSPGTGAWWVGLAISQEALERRKEASESFYRAKGTGNLNAELLAYVDRRLKQLQ